MTILLVAPVTPVPSFTLRYGCLRRAWRLQFHPGPGVGLGDDYTLYAQESGIVVFKQTKYQNKVRQSPPPSRPPAQVHQGPSAGRSPPVDNADVARSSELDVLIHFHAKT